MDVDGALSNPNRHGDVPFLFMKNDAQHSSRMIGNTIGGSVDDASKEQETEMEALQAIFGEDLELLEPSKPYRRSCRIRLSLPGACQLLALTFHLSDKYPLEDSARVFMTTGNMDAWSVRRRVACEQHLQAVADDARGYPSLYAVFDAAMEWLSQRETVYFGKDTESKQNGGQVRETRDELATRFETMDTAYDDQVEAETAEHQRIERWLGTPVTRETFAEWSRNFEVYIVEQGIDLLGGGDGHEPQGNTGERGVSTGRKLTGREWFEMHQNAMDDDHDADRELDGSHDDGLVSSDADIERDLFLVS